MKKVITALAVVLVLLGVSSVVNAADTATKPAQVPSVQPVLYSYDVASVVTVDGPSVITLVTSAYRHAPAVQARVITTEAGTFEIRDRCKPYRLPMTWTVYVDGVKVGVSASLKCN